MDVTVRVPAQLRDLVDGASTVAVRLTARPPTVGAALDALAETHPPLERRVRDERGNLRPHVNLFVGADNIRDRDGSATELIEGQELAIIPAVSGG
jgi:sulfur-carrier protein